MACFSKHSSFVTGSNAHGTWQHCGVCGIRVSYILRMGSSGRSVQRDHPKTVENAMKQVEIDLRPQGRVPEKALVDLMINIVDTHQRVAGLKTQLMQMEENQLLLEARYQRELKMAAKDELKKEDSELLAHLTPAERSGAICACKGFLVGSPGGPWFQVSQSA